MPPLLHSEYSPKKMTNLSFFQKPYCISLTNEIYFKKL